VRGENTYSRTVGRSDGRTDIASSIGQQCRDNGTQLGGVRGIETPRDGGCADVGNYFEL